MSILLVTTLEESLKFVDVKFAGKIGTAAIADSVVSVIDLVDKTCLKEFSSSLGNPASAIVQILGHYRRRENQPGFLQ